MESLRDTVLLRIKSLGREAAADFFGVNKDTLDGWMSGEWTIPLEAAEKVYDSTTRFVKTLTPDWEGRKVCLLLPFYKSTHPVTAFSLLGMVDRTKIGVIMNFGDAFIAHVRNTLAKQFLDSGIEWAMMVDDDMIVPWGNAAWFNRMTGFNLPDKFAGLHAASRLLSHGKTLVGSLYFGRNRAGKPMYAEGMASADQTKWLRANAPLDQVQPTKWVGTGCILIHRDVFTDIEKKFPQLARDPNRKDVVGGSGHWFSSSEHDIVEETQRAIEILNDHAMPETARIDRAAKLLHTARQRSKINSALGTGEDVQFCVRAAQAGHQPHVDLGLLCGHIGSQCFGPGNTVSL